MQSNEGATPAAPTGSLQGLLASLRQLTDDELLTRLVGLAARERRATALVVAHLAELDTRDVHLRDGHSSLFNYCRSVLAFSEHEAYNRMEAARTARRFPLILDLLAAGEVNLTTIRLLGPHLTAANHASVLELARGKRKFEIEEIVARLSPRGEVAPCVRKLPAPKLAGPKPPAMVVGAPAAQVATVAGSAQAVAPTAGPGTGLLPAGPVPAPLACPDLTAGVASAGFGCATPEFGCATADLVPSPARRSGEVRPLSPDRYRYQLTIGASTLEKLRLARDMLRHALPSGDDEAILDRALTALLEDLARKRFGGEKKDFGTQQGSSVAQKKELGAEEGSPVAKRSPFGEEKDSVSSDETSSSFARGEAPDRRHVPLAGRGAAAGSRHVPVSGRGAGPGSRHVPVAVKRAVWVRDLGRCAFVAPDGRRCGERAFVQFHHVKPFAIGGEATVDQIELRCGRHNRYEARLFFAREPAGGDRRHEGTGTPAKVCGTIGELSVFRSGTNA